MKKSLFLVIIFILSASLSHAQLRSISGKVTDENEEPLQGANVALYTHPDTLLFRGSAADLDGQFILRRIPQGEYRLVITFLGFSTAMIPVQVGEEDIENLNIRIHEEPFEMEGVEITARAQPVVVSGDTTSFNAAAFPVRSDAVAEDLIRRMPGFTIQDGRIHAQGEEVEQVLVDGEEFFGRDPMIALRNLPAEIIRQVQVFDQASEQAEFSGFDDGQTIRTINIVTRGGIIDGQFGRAHASMGTDERYLGSGNYNTFSGTRRVSVLGLTNNINQMNFTSDYLSGVMQASQATSARSGGRGGGGGGGGGGSSGGSESWTGPDNTRDFMVDEQQGINNVHSFGLNYIDRWNQNWRISSSYFFNATSNSNNRTIERQFLEEDQMNDFYTERSLSASDHYNHRLNARIEYTIDPRRSLIFRPRMNLQTQDIHQELFGNTTSGLDQLLNQMDFNYHQENLSYDLGGSLLYRQRFETSGRTLSAFIQTDFDNLSGDQLQIGESRFFADFDRISSENQLIEIQTGSRSAAASFQYTEPLTERSQIQFGYRPSITLSQSERNALLPDSNTGLYDLLNTGLTSQYDNREISHGATTGYRFRGDGYHFNTSVSLQHTSLFGEQYYPYASETRRTFWSILPRAMFSYNFSPTRSLRIMYNVQSRTPSVTQLQDVIDNSNPLMLTGGNPDLTQQYVHRLNTRFRSINAEQHTSILGFLSISYTQNHIGNSTYLAERDTVLAGNIILGRGGRLIIPEHTGNSWQVRSFLNYSLPVEFLYSNLNLNSGIRYRLTPTLINGERNIGHNTGVDTGVILNSTISRELDFTVSYNAGYNFVRNTLREELDNDFYSGRAVVQLHALPWDWLILETDFNLLHYYGLGDDFNQDIYFWNATVGYRFLSNRAAQLRFTVTDILGQNSSVNRMVSDLFVQDVRSEVLTRFFMVTLAYNFRSFREGGIF